MGLLVKEGKGCEEGERQTSCSYASKSEDEHFHGDGTAEASSVDVGIKGENVGDRFGSVLAKVSHSEYLFFVYISYVPRPSRKPLGMGNEYSKVERKIEKSQKAK